MSPRLTPILLLIVAAGHPALRAADANAAGVPLIKADATPPGTPRVTITVRGEKRIIEANGIPAHKVGTYPNRGNPNRIGEQRYRFEIPVHPKPADQAAPQRPGALWGVALNGVVFDPGTAEVYNDGDRSNPWKYEALMSNTLQGVTPKIRTGLGIDENHAHVQPNGAYHYHGLPTLLIAQLSGGEQKMTHVGWAADGYPIYAVYGYSDAADAASPVKALRSSYRLKTQPRPGDGKTAPTGQPNGAFGLDFEYVDGLGDLDEFGGRQGVTPEFPKGTYYYVLTEDYPFVPRKLKGTPDPSFNTKGSGNNNAGAPGQRGRPGGPEGRPGPGPGGPGGPPPR
jgi:hypothetical protein